MSTCQNCSTQFEITPEDAAFYAKVKIPHPTFCPFCRVQRRMAWRNDRSFYLRQCDRSHEKFVSIYPEKTKFPVYKPSEWYKDDWDPRKFGQDFDFNRPFFDQFQDLINEVPRLGIDIVHCENSDYCNYCGDDKDCYLDLAGEANENCYFCLYTKHSRFCTDCTFVYNSELCHECINCYDCYNDKFSMYLENCNDCAFSFDLKGCSDCLFCNNLRHKKYYIFNKPYSKEEYMAEFAKMNFGSYSSLKNMIAKWKENMKKAIHRDMYIMASEECDGNDIKNSKNCHDVYNVINCWDSKYLYDVLDAKDCYDLNYSLYKPEVACELISTLAMKFSAFNMASHYCDNVFYCDQCNNSSFMFGCIAINRGKYCILNKQYSEEEYRTILPKIIAHMTTTKEFGEFFPTQMSLWGYNETVAHEYMPLTKEQALAKNYKWKEQDKREYKPQTAVIPDDIKQTTDSIIKDLLACDKCEKNFHIISQELQRYRALNLPIPHTCPDCRHRNRIFIRTSRRLNSRTCASCSSPIKTPYSSNFPKQVLCEKCYIKAVV
ncbi:MAG: hypothetical protein US89_C0001G0041 [Candidatus Peregrinibacteria bacterium GW2011_GWF2_38_29]|nr:MAG: hypothetical protein US89_C0001G0041 [Candidatus Peregrinibacteria bacterium GW2011_GWF2_38_29]HBB03076.1 hypothetical protein [Candidatus Peregrinibacteria bacterium]